MQQNTDEKMAIPTLNRRKKLKQFSFGFMSAMIIIFQQCLEILLNRVIHEGMYTMCFHY